MKDNPKMTLLRSIQSPEDIRHLTLELLADLADEIREFLIQSLSETGGHLASSLGTVELTIAMHYVFDSPRDRICWDVGHQAYTHKLLTGRMDQFNTLRKYKGLSGFPKQEESEYDVFSVGHAGTSISSALGIVEANRLLGTDRKTIAIIGDGSLTSGLAFEGLNQAGQLDRNLIIVLNDNEFSISPNVGAMSSFLSRKLAGTTGRSIRKRLKKFLTSIPGIGNEMFRMAKRSEDIFKAMFTPGFLFEALGFEYVGPIKGHNLGRLIETFENISALENPVLMHVATQKGKGYGPAELNPSAFHGVCPFVMETGEPKPSKRKPQSYTSVFGNTVVELAHSDQRIVGITAAMFEGTGLEKLAEVFPDRCYDVGIAEQHGITFAAGLAREGLKPIAAIYSTFLQRSYDQILHDVALQDLPVILAVDRGGLVGADGPTHHGAFDLSYLRHIPRLIIMAPKDENELRHMLFSAINIDKPCAVRYPRGPGLGVEMDKEFRSIPIGKAEIIKEGSDISLVGIGNMVQPCISAAKILETEGISAAVINGRFAKPIDGELITKWARSTGTLITVEENSIIGGFGAGVLEALSQSGVSNIKTKIMGIPDIFVEHGSQEELRSALGLTDESIAQTSRKLLEQ